MRAGVLTGASECSENRHLTVSLVLPCLQSESPREPGLATRFQQIPGDQYSTVQLVVFSLF